MHRDSAHRESVPRSDENREQGASDPRFLADGNLGRLVTWLRILGYDTMINPGLVNRSFLRRAQREGRVVLTRRRDMAGRQFAGRLVVVEGDRVREQIGEVVERLSLKPAAERFFSRCLRCNLVLERARREDVERRVPEYVYRHAEDFRQCAGCLRVYWPGTHRENACRFFRERTPAHPP